MNTVINIANLLLEKDNILILTHIYPDGDTLGSAFALCRALQIAGKKASVECSHEIPLRYSFLSENMISDEFQPDFVVAVDIADPELLGNRLSIYKDKTDLCIDHHVTNKLFAKQSYINSNASATAEIIYDIIANMNIKIDTSIATCIYTGISTDTGCFKYSNTTPNCHIIAAKTMELGVDFGEINRIMFEAKSRARIMLEKMALQNIEFYFDDRCALTVISSEILDQSGATEADLEGITSLPRQVDGVLIGITMREKSSGGYKISMRTHAPIDASAICAKLGGGGHIRASGCTLEQDLVTSRNLILDICKEALELL